MSEMPRWIVGEDPYAEDDEIRYLSHHQAPRFCARWSFGPPPVAPQADSRLYRDDDAGDAIHIFDFAWLDKEPDEDTFNALMEDAIELLDQWLEVNSEPIEEHQH